MFTQQIGLRIFCGDLERLKDAGIINTTGPATLQWVQAAAVVATPIIIDVLQCESGQAHKSPRLNKT